MLSLKSVSEDDSQASGSNNQDEVPNTTDEDTSVKSSPNTQDGENSNPEISSLTGLPIESNCSPNRKKRKIINKCCNTSCEGSQLLEWAPLFAEAFYGHPHDKGVLLKICAKCLSTALEHQQLMIEALSSGRPLVQEDYIRQLKDDTVTLSDSDDEEYEDMENILPYGPKVTLTYDINEVIAEELEKCNLKYQIDEALSMITEKHADFKESTQTLDEDLEKFTQEFQSFYAGIYTDYSPTVREIAPLDIEPEAIITPTSTPTRRTPTTPPSRQFQPKIPSLSPIRQIQQQQQQFQHQQLQLRPPMYISPMNRARSNTPSPGTPKTVFPGQGVSKLSKSLLITGNEGNNSEGMTDFEKDNAGVAMKKVTQISQRRSDLDKQPEIVHGNSSGLTDEVVVFNQVPLQTPPLPPLGLLERPRLAQGDMVFAMRSSTLSAWVKAKVVEPPRLVNNEAQYKVRFDQGCKKYSIVKTIVGRHLAYSTPALVRLIVGTRVVALFIEEGNNPKLKPQYYAGIIAEPPKVTNKYRYLVFFDDGYAQYVSHEYVSVVIESSKDVWEDVHAESREFLKKYLSDYPERPMVKLQVGQVIKTEWNAKWWIARVADVDASLAKMQFDADNRTEWIYRGSTRFSPLFNVVNSIHKKNPVLNQISRRRITQAHTKNVPYVEYTHGSAEDAASQGVVVTDPERERERGSGAGRAVARKSTTATGISVNTSLPGPGLPMRTTCIGDGTITMLSKKTNFSRVFRPHQCGAVCISQIPFDREKMKEVNLLLIPLYCGWDRQMVRHRNGGKRMVFYVAPCGRRLRNMDEVHLFLRFANSTMGVDLFCFDFWVHCFSEFVPDASGFFIKDISYGKENVPVSCMNRYSNNYPEFVEYATMREPRAGVNLNLDPDFLVGCDCTDDCQDRDKCSCWQLTIQGTAYNNKRVDQSVGYVYRRLPESVITGIYECNSRCKCCATCTNRVVQNHLQLKLQVFRTEKKGWGIRCLNDIPQGSFICIYAGQLHTEQGANEEGKNFGDEYLAELDYIEVVERLKEDFESDVDITEDVEDEVDTPPSIRRVIPDNVKRVSSMEEEEEEEYEDTENNSGLESDEEFQVGNKIKVVPATNAGERRSTRITKKNLEKNPTVDEEKKKLKVKQLTIEGKKETGSTSDRNEGSDDEETEEESTIRKPTSFGARTEPKRHFMNSDWDEERNTFVTVRKYFQDTENVYIMDAKSKGNIGRYLNHSCAPNVFVQNVFVDTHDIRFPWVAFFALTFIRAGTELTWDYNYDIGSVPGKHMFCYCEAPGCRGRLL